MHRLLIVFPTAWDRRQLQRCRTRWSARYEPVFGVPSDEDCTWDFDVLGYIERAVREFGGNIDGVTSSSDYPGATAAGAIATRLGLPGTPPANVIRCSHKYYSRLVQREAVPEATPRFWLVDPNDPATLPPGLEFPCFVKPVKGAFSIMARKIEGPEALAAFLAGEPVREFVRSYLFIFNRLVARLTDLELDGSWFLAEEFLYGAQVTVEGFVCAGEVEVLGIVDSVMHPGTKSFARFDYPSALRPEIRVRMEDIARRVVAALDLRDTLFNVEMIYEPAGDTIRILEINPRMCGQFADLYEKVDGINGYEVAFAIASGERPRLQRGQGAFAVASSFPLRTFEPVRVLVAPDDAHIRAVEASCPGALVWSECTSGQELTDFERLEDGASARYAILNLGAESREALQRRFEEVRARLGYRFTAAATTSRSG